MYHPDGKLIRKKCKALEDERRIEKDLLLKDAEKRWKEEDDVIIRECLEKTGHQFEPTPNRHRNLVGTLLRVCIYCGDSIYKN